MVSDGATFGSAGAGAIYGLRDGEVLSQAIVGFTMLIAGYHGGGVATPNLRPSVG